MPICKEPDLGGYLGKSTNKGVRFAGNNGGGSNKVP